MPRLTICGGGNAAHVLIALACAAGWEVDVYAPYGDEARRLAATYAANGGVMAHFPDGRVIHGHTRCVSNRAADVIPGSSLTLLTLPAFAHRATLQQIAPHLDSGATVGALPARSGFEYDIHAVFPISNLQSTSLQSPTFFALQTLPWACRVTAYGREVQILGTKAVVDIAVRPSGQTAQTARELGALFGQVASSCQLRPVSSFLTLTLANTGQLIHPGIMYGRFGLGALRKVGSVREPALQHPDEAPLFYQGLDEETTALLQALNDEVQAVAAALEGRVPGFDAAEVTPLHDWLLHAYPHDIQDGRSLRGAFNSNRAYFGLRAPVRRGPNGAYTVDYRARYLSEDVPFGLVVVRGIVQLLQPIAPLQTPAIDEVISWAQDRLGHSYLSDGTLNGADLAHSRAPQAYSLETFADLRAIYQPDRQDSRDKNSR